jgi:cell shape-determining protein MreC
LTAQQITDLNNGDLCVNLGTDTFPSGLIRGEINEVPEPSTLALVGTGSLAWLAGVRRKRRAQFAAGV